MILPRLPFPVRITEQNWPTETVPVVTIRCTTFNHGKFVRDAFEGFLMQETTFPVEILVHDDASTDSTTDIILEYHGRYPQIVRTVLQRENQLSKGIKPGRSINPLFRGEFIAFCEGDDYWTSPFKLEQQVRGLEANETALLSFHGHKEVDAVGSSLPPRDARLPEEGLLPQGAYFAGKCESWQTASLVIRSDLVLNPPSWCNRLPFGDVNLMALASLRGPLYCLPGVHSCYRIHQNGIASKRRLEKDVTGKNQKALYWNESLALLFKYLINETSDPTLQLECRKKHASYIEDAIWNARLIGDRKRMRQLIWKAFGVNQKRFILSSKMWKNILIAFLAVPDFRRNQHLGPSCD